MHTTGNESFAGEKTFTSDMTLSSTDAGASAGPVLNLYRNSASPADADYLGQVKFEGENDADEKIVYSKITGKILDASDGSEDGIIEFANKKAGTTTITARLRSDSLQLLNDTSLVVSGLTYPTSDGTSGQVLKTDGSGTLSFGAVSVENVAKVTSLSFGSLTDYDVITASATVTSDFGTVANTGNTFNDHGFIFRDSGLPQLPSYTVATLPSTVAGDLALCTDETGGSTVVFFDGTNWRRMADRAVAS